MDVKCPKCGELFDHFNKKSSLKCCKCGKENVKSFYFAFEYEGDERIICAECKEGGDNREEDVLGGCH